MLSRLIMHTYQSPRQQMKLKTSFRNLEHFYENVDLRKFPAIWYIDCRPSPHRELYSVCCMAVPVQVCEENDRLKAQAKRGGEGEGGGGGGGGGGEGDEMTRLKAENTALQKSK